MEKVNRAFEAILARRSLNHPSPALPDAESALFPSPLPPRSERAIYHRCFVLQTFRWYLHMSAIHRSRQSQSRSNRSLCSHLRPCDAALMFRACWCQGLPAVPIASLDSATLHVSPKPRQPCAEWPLDMGVIRVFRHEGPYPILTGLSPGRGSRSQPMAQAMGNVREHSRSPGRGGRRSNRNGRGWCHTTSIGARKRGIFTHKRSCRLFGTLKCFGNP